MLFKLKDGREIPVELYKTRVVQKINLIPARARLKAIEEAGYNTFQLKTRDVFLDMLTDSGVNAMSDNQWAGWITTDDAYAGSMTFYEFADAVKEVLGYNYVMNVHQGRAAEHLLSKVFCKPEGVVITNYHFTTTRAHIEVTGISECLELYTDEALNTKSTHPFKGNMDIDKLKAAIKKYGREKIGYVRMEATTNLLGGQPFSMENFKEVRKVCDENGLLLVLDGSLISENAYFIWKREKGYENKTIAQIIKEMCSIPDIFYLSGRKNTCVRGGFIATNNKELFAKLEPWLPVYEGFYTYGGMSMREIGAMAVGLKEMVDPSVAGCAIEQIKYFVEKLDSLGIPVVTPPGGLACHIDARKFVPHIKKEEYISGALTAALYIVSGVRAMERGTISMDRAKDGTELYADLELTRIAIPRRVYSISHIEYIIERLQWLYEHRDLIKGLKFIFEPPVLRFFLGKLAAIDNWGEKLTIAFEKDFGTDW
ncbi:MAG: tryptophanase [candidate division WOR-3 bacterium]|nr:tryptophanase [candidate division WOR-3 bacterium]